MNTLPVLMLSIICLCSYSLSSQSVSKLIDIEDAVIRLEEDRDIIRLDDGTTYILFSTNDNEILINNETYLGRNLTEEEYEQYDDANGAFYWIVKLLPDFSIDRVLSFTGISEADITKSRDKIYLGFSAYYPVISVGDEVVQLTEDYDGCLLTLDLDLNFDEIVLENDLRFHSFDSSDDHLVMQFWMARGFTQDYCYFGLDTLYNFDDWNELSPVIVVYDTQEEKVIHNWIYGSKGMNDNRKINLSNDETIFTTLFAGGSVQFTSTVIDTVSYWKQLAARYAVDGDLLWRTQPTANYDNFAYANYVESNNGDYYLGIRPRALDTTFVLQDTIIHNEGLSRSESIIKYNYDGESQWIFSPDAYDGRFSLNTMVVSNNILSGVYYGFDNGSLIFADSIYTNYDGANLFFNLNAETGEEISSFLLSPEEQSIQQIVRYLSHDYDNDKVYLGIESLKSKADLFGTTIGDLDESHLYFIELDMNFLVSTDDLEVDNSLMKVYPNPVEGQDLLFIDSYSTIAGEYNLYDPQGRLAITGTKPRGIAHHSFSTQGIASGVYILKYQEEKKIQNQIIIIK